ncbi:MAG: preprotein translocase subunit SecA [Deltaproteobacteria bacterium]|nr:preprotein translocase subunit SecA [Deltaproteobacteria bacterium]
MLSAIGKKIFGSRNERELKRVAAIVDRVNSLENSIRTLDDDALRSKTGQFKERVEKGESLDDLLPEAFAVVRETAHRTLNMRHFDVQIIGGVFLHEGTITEMKTGEGKTLVATLAVYLNSLTGHGVHVVTVNDYLATRDSEWMGNIYSFLGLTVGIIRHDMGDVGRKAAYAADVTYGTNNEFGFDYLRDNMKFSLEDYVQRELNFAIVDEVDSILVDEARTPLIISGPAEESTDKYYTVDKIIPRLRPEVHYTIDEKARSVMLTEDGVANTERLLGVENLYEPGNIEINHHVQQALKAHVLFKRDVDYVVKDGQVIIVDEFTGRLMEGRRYSDGLHQALEAKEGVKIESENQTLASITFQNYFRMYNKLSGMTGTADTEAAEFKKIYNLDVLVMPTHLPMIRQDNPDVIFRTRKELNEAVGEEIADLHRRGQPVLVGTASIENSELLSRMLKRAGVPHHVLNAKHHEREAEIVAQAGRLGAVTIATNMAGRGTDIVLGGNPESLARNKSGGDTEGEEYQRLLEEFKSICEDERQRVLEAGGLHILGTERHESRRIDNQLRGRSGRQGDPGSSRFYISLEDDLMRIFGSERISGLMERLGMTEGQPIENSMVTKAIENAQRKVEGHNFDIREHLLEYDDVMNQQREVVYGQRRNILGSEDLSDWVMEMADEIIEEAMDIYVDPKDYIEDWDLDGLGDRILSIFGFRPDMEEAKNGRDALGESIVKTAHARYEERESEFGSELMRRLEKIFLLQVLDAQWKDHLYNMDQLREGIGLRGYGQRDPLSEYKIEGYEMFETMMTRARDETVTTLYMVQVTSEEEDLPQRKKQRIQLGRGESGGERAKPGTVRRKEAKIGRNAPCPCGSGKKYKKCCGSVA